jgi:hypothetical protein
MVWVNWNVGVERNGALLVAVAFAGVFLIDWVVSMYSEMIAVATLDPIVF